MYKNKRTLFIAIKCLLKKDLRLEDLLVKLINLLRKALIFKSIIIANLNFNKLRVVLPKNFTIIFNVCNK